MSVAKIQSANYAAFLQSVTYTIPPFLQDDGTPSLPLCAWLAAYTSALLTYQVHEGEDLTDSEKNRLLCNLLGDSTRQRLGLHTDGARMEADTLTHASFLHAVHLRLRDLVDHSSSTQPSSTTSGAGQAQHKGAIPFQVDKGRRRKGKRAEKALSFRLCCRFSAMC